MIYFLVLVIYSTFTIEVSETTILKETPFNDISLKEIKSEEFYDTEFEKLAKLVRDEKESTHVYTLPSKEESKVIQKYISNDIEGLNALKIKNDGNIKHTYYDDGVIVYHDHAIGHKFIRKGNKLFHISENTKQFKIQDNRIVEPYKFFRLFNKGFVEIPELLDGPKDQVYLKTTLSKFKKYIISDADLKILYKHPKSSHPVYNPSTQTLTEISDNTVIRKYKDGTIIQYKNDKIDWIVNKRGHYYKFDAKNRVSKYKNDNNDIEIEPLLLTSGIVYYSRVLFLVLYN